MVVALVAMTALVGAACTAPPSSFPVAGGTYDIDVTVPSQSFSYDFLVCSATASTAPVQLTGAQVTVPSITVDPSLAVISVPNVAVEIPAGTAAAGQVSISCLGTSLGSVDISLTIAGTVTATDAVLNTATQQLSLAGATIVLDGATVEIPGVGSVPLPPFEVDLGSIQIDY